MYKCNYLRKRNDGVILVESISDLGNYLLQKETGLKMVGPVPDVGEKYIDSDGATKFRPMFYHYEETNIPVEAEEV